MTAEQFLKEKGILQGDCKEFIISFDDGRKVVVNDLLEEYGKQQYKDGYCAGSDSIHKILMPELETQRRLNAAQKKVIAELEQKLNQIKEAIR